LTFFSDVPGLECLYHEFMNDNEIASAVRNINK